MLPRITEDNMMSTIVSVQGGNFLQTEIEIIKQQNPHLWALVTSYIELEGEKAAASYLLGLCHCYNLLRTAQETKELEEQWG